MKVAACLALIVFCGCAHDPVITGKPKHWTGKPSADLRAAWGEPTRIMAAGSNGEYWEYSKTGEFHAPAEKRMRFRAGTGFGAASGGVTTTQTDARMSRFEDVVRFLVRDGKVRKWSATQLVDGRVVWTKH